MSTWISLRKVNSYSPFIRRRQETLAVVFLDLAKAFDTISHSDLLKKLHA